MGVDAKMDSLGDAFLIVDSSAGRTANVSFSGNIKRHRYRVVKLR
jgi:hypothetical protein